MRIIRYATPAVGIGVETRAGRVHPLPHRSLAELLRLPRLAVQAAVDAALAVPTDLTTDAVRLLPPVDGLTEVWAAGVTYARSSAARQEESVVADVYSRVYDAERPELFFKGVAWRAVGHDEPIGIRPDSAIDVPEPELALVVNAGGEVVGVTACDDVSSRAIEGENPLYLPQAKIYAGALALGPGITPVWELDEHGGLGGLGITVQVLRGTEVVWAGATSTAVLHRAFDDLVEHARRHLAFPDGLVLSTGTGLVPDLDVTLRDGDVVEVVVDGVGTLRNPVRDATHEAFAWLTPEPTRTPA